MTNRGENETIGFIGAGRIGRPLVRALLGAGYEVRIHDKFRAAAEPVITEGAIWSPSPKDAALGARAVIICLARPEHVWECMMGDQGALAGMTAGAVWINTSTTDYHSSQKIAQAAQDKGIYSLEGPVSNISHMGVDFGNSSIYCAGDKAAYDASQDILETITAISFFTGKIGTAQAVKLLTNLVFYGSVSICADCVAITQSAGIPNHWMWEQIRLSRANSVAASQFIPMVLDGSYDTSCSLEIGVKDMALTVALGNELGVDLPLGQIVSDRYALAGATFGQAGHHLTVAKLTEVANGFDIRIPGFVAPSKYGRNAGFEHSNEVDRDALGRLTPRLPEGYAASEFTPTHAQQRVMETVVAFMTATNHALNKEAVALGQGIGLTPPDLEQMILWSVGSNWALENAEAYAADQCDISNMPSLIKALHLPFIESIEAVVAEDQRRSRAL